MEIKSIKKGKGNVKIKDILLRIPIGNSVTIEHKNYYCKGGWSSCTVAHYIHELKEDGKGNWKIKHLEVGVVEVTRLN